MPESALLDLTATDVTEQSWEDLVRSMAGYDPDSTDPDPPTGCGIGSSSSSSPDG